MRMISTRYFSMLMLALGPLAICVDAKAIEPPFSEGRTTASGGIRFGGNDLNLGVGARIGHTLADSRVYIGGLADYWFGEHEEVSVAGQSITADASGFNVIANVGYDLGLAPTVVLRPFGGAGLFHAEAEVCTSVPGIGEDCIDASEDDAVGIFGAQGLFLVGSSLHLGAELRVMFAEESAFILAGNLGGVF